MKYTTEGQNVYSISLEGIKELICIGTSIENAMKIAARLETLEDFINS